MLPKRKREREQEPSSWPLLPVVIATTVLGLAWVYVGVVSSRHPLSKASPAVPSSLIVAK